MFRYPSNVVFLYYDDFSHGEYMMNEVLDLNLVMDQGFAKIYQINKTSYLGIVQKKDTHKDAGSTLVSMNTTHLQEEYKRIQNYEVVNCTDILYFEQIPLHSFFFEDREGHRFEIQQFEQDEDVKQFTVYVE